jgi:hypothetical protein
VYFEIELDVKIKSFKMKKKSKVENFLNDDGRKTGDKRKE